MHASQIDEEPPSEPHRSRIAGACSPSTTVLGVNGIRLLGRRSGVGRAIEAILCSLDAVEHPFGEVRVYTPEALEPDLVLPCGGVNVVLTSSLPLGLWEQVRLPLAHGARHLLLCPSYVAPVLPSHCPIVLIHHGSYEGYPEAFPWWPRTKARWINALSARRATLVSTVSEHSKREIMRFYGLPEAKIRVIPEGVNTALFRPIRDPAALTAWRRRTLGGDDAPCLLYVGKPSPRRNLPNLLRAFARLKRTHRLPHRLVLIGTALPGSRVEGLVRELELEREVVCVGFAGHEEIALAYNASEMLLYPSSYEGFGMPVLEAMACGTPAIALDNTAFPEFAGGVADLLPDAEVDTLATAILELHRDPARRARMAEAGPVRAAAYDWRLITERYVALMRELVAVQS